MRVSDIQGVKVYRALSEDKKTRRDGSVREPKRLGRIHFPVFLPSGTRLVGFMVKLPDVAGMVKQPDRFVALDALDVDEGMLVASGAKDSFDAAAAKRLRIDLDSCLILTGMDVVTVSGKPLGYCKDAVFNANTGKVSSFMLTTGGAATTLLGDIEMPAALYRSYTDGAMIVADEVASLSLSGGAAAKAAEVSVTVSKKVKQASATLDEKGSKALDKGSRALGKQLGRTRGMFSAFASEYRKAAGTSKKSGGAKKK